ncbi:helix-turn-helix transcriptional regulator [Clostridium tagluense]|uniref:helix-turn-helix transcriptional regulator n=1 Tax=Clostridium tagluense TaxID=360422 RepID=UPI001C6E5CFF|nr:YafY family protein [Clostridium tagluense]MBW9156161.1 YafY family transcriptional regulator [Clostridium tagluense]WLC65600.1 YafY family transcriptional regulator [Clostridium tagluense]
MKIDRLISIIMVLLNYERVSAIKLAKMFEVSPRTIYRDIETISLAGIPIVTHNGVNGGISIMQEYKIDKKLFTVSDISTLLMGLASVSTTLSNKEIIGTLEKVKSLLPKEQFRDIELKSNQITVDLTTWMGNKSFQPNLEKIKKALSDSKYLLFEYYGVNREKDKRCIEPYKLVLKERNWYLQGYCTLREDFRVFKLSRISNLEILESTFVPREFQAKPLDGSGWIDKRLITTKLLVDWSLREQMVERCGEENIEPYGNDKFIVDFPFVEDDFGYNILMGFGDKCECLAPENVRIELINRIKKLLHVYGN